MEKSTQETQGGDCAVGYMPVHSLFIILASGVIGEALQAHLLIKIIHLLPGFQHALVYF